MKQKLLFFACLVLGAFFVFAGHVDNADNPVHGSWDFKPEIIWGNDQAGDQVLSSGSSTVGSRGDVFFLDKKAGKVFVFNRDGKYLRSFGSRGEGPGEFKYPLRIDALNGKILVTGFTKVSYFNEQGGYIKFETLSPQMQPLSFIDENRYLFKGKNKTGIPFLNLYDFSSKKVIPLAKYDLKIRTTKSMNIISSQKNDPVFGTPSSILYGKFDRCEIVRLDLHGKIIATFGIKTRPQRTVSKEEKIKRVGQKMINRLKGYMVDGRSAVDAYLDTIPDKDPYYYRIDVLENGLILAFIPNDKKPGIQLDIFSKSGKYLYYSDLVLPDGLKMYKLPVISGNYLYAFTEDEDGEQRLIKFKISLPKA